MSSAWWILIGPTNNWLWNTPLAMAVASPKGNRSTKLLVQSLADFFYMVSRKWSFLSWFKLKPISAQRYQSWIVGGRLKYNNWHHWKISIYIYIYIYIMKYRYSFWIHNHTPQSNPVEVLDEPIIWKQLDCFWCFGPKHAKPCRHFDRPSVAQEVGQSRSIFNLRRCLVLSMGMERGNDNSNMLTGLCSTDCSQTWGKHQWRNWVFNHPMSTVVHDDGQKQTYLPGPGLNNRYAIYNLSNLYTLSTFSDVGPPHEIASNWLLPHSGIA